MTGPWTCSGDWWTILRLIWKQSFPDGLAEVTSQSRLAAAKQMHEMKSAGQRSQGLYYDSQTALWVRANILASRRHRVWYTNACCVKRCFAQTKLESILHVKESTHKRWRVQFCWLQDTLRTANGRLQMKSNGDVLGQTASKKAPREGQDKLI